MPSSVIVGISGGVDSAVAALLLKRDGYAVQGLFMSNWDEDDAYCTSAQDFQDARAICTALEIPLHRVNFALEYRERVFAHFLSEYRSGRTPNPDVMCNREIKFGVCFDYMQRLGADRIATGHYAKVVDGDGGVELHKAQDRNKDQSYFLHAVAKPALERTLFPLADIDKNEVRAMAHRHGIPVYDKPDSTGICFIGERPFREFLSRYLVTRPGPSENAAGEIIGEHHGLSFYTIGQRSGLGLGGRAGAQAAPWYVAEKDLGRNALIVVQQPDDPLLLSDHFIVDALHWLAGRPRGHFNCSVKTRYRQADLPCAIEWHGDGKLHVELADPARAVTPGQYAVFYAQDRCLGGGVIIDRTVHGRIAYNNGLSAEVSDDGQL
jgi:tRNA-uridine 2-sulfurtransferase